MITVTQQDIDRGVKHSGKECPIALAVNRAATLGDELWHVRYPREVGYFIRDFDAGQPVKPFSFWLPVS